MAAIPPIHEDPPVGTNNIVAPPDADRAPDAQQQPSTQPVEQSPALPADWSPVASSPSDDAATTAPEQTPR